MAEVPYQPFSTVTPISGGEQLRVAAPPEAFGVNVGQAIEHLGTTTQQVGNEMFQRAQALQELKNQTDAQNAGIEHAVEAGKMEADYKSLPDQQRADTLPQYLERQKALREQFRAKLTNPMAQHYFDADSVPFTRRIIFAASALAGEAQKKFTVDTLKAKVDLDLKSMEDDPGDVSGNTQRSNDVAQDVTTLTQLEHGVDDPNHPLVKDALMHATSKSIVSQAMGWLKTDPEKTMDFIDQNKSKMTIDDYNRVRDMAEFKSNSIVSANITREVLGKHLQPDGSYDASTKELQDEVRQIAQERHPDNKLLPIAAVKTLDGQLYTDRYASRLDFIDAKKSFLDMLAKYNPKNSQEFLAIPGADMLVQKLPPDIKNNLDTTIFNYRTKANKVTREETRVYLNGMKNNDVEQFLNIPDFSKYDGLNASDIIKLQNEQAALVRNPRDDPRVNKAMQILKSYYPQQMQDLHIYRRDVNATQKQKDYDSFTGMLQEALQTHLEDTGKPATPTEIKEKIAPALLRTHAVSHLFGAYTTQEPMFRGWSMPKPEDVPGDFKDKAVRDVIEKGGAQPTDHQIYQAYLRMLFNKTLKESGGAEPGK